jgi:hypothetical protein
VIGATLAALSWAAQPAASGFVELRGSYAVGASGQAWQLVERFRPTFDAPLSERIRLSTTIEAGLSQGRNTTTELRRLLETSELGPLLEAADCTWPVDDNTLFHTNDAGDYLAVDRLTLDLYQPGFDVRIGRQALQWGSALFINPTDPFPQVLFTQPWLPRAGVNSARVSVPFGERNQLQAVVGTNDDFNAARIAGRGTINWAQTDWSAVGAWRQETDEMLAGIDIKGTFGVGFWFESALRVGDLSGEEATVRADAAVGVDYSFPLLETLYVAGQYVRQGESDTPAAPLAGVEGPTCALDAANFATSEPDPFAPFLTGRDYGLGVVRLGLHPNVDIGASWLQALDDGTAVAIPNASWRLPAQFDVSLTAQIPLKAWGDGGELAPREADLRLDVPGTDLSADLSGLVPDATVIVWTRKTF